MNTVTGYGPEIGMEIIRNPKVAKVAFTGSDYSGQKVYEQAAGIKHVCLELGESPSIVFEDANIDAAIAGVLSGILRRALKLASQALDYFFNDRFMINC